MSVKRPRNSEAPRPDPERPDRDPLLSRTVVSGLTAGLPETVAGRALLERESLNSRSFALITPEAIVAIEKDAAHLARLDLMLLVVDCLHRSPRPVPLAFCASTTASRTRAVARLRAERRDRELAPAARNHRVGEGAHRQRREGRSRLVVAMLLPGLCRTTKPCHSSHRGLKSLKNLLVTCSTPSPE